MSNIIDYRPFMDNENKVYVKVSADIDPSGNIEPVSFVWEDGSRYEIDKIIDKRPAASLKAGGVGIRYSIKVRSRQTYIWLEECHGCQRWFMERK